GRPGFAREPLRSLRQLRADPRRVPVHRVCLPRARRARPVRRAAAISRHRGVFGARISGDAVSLRHSHSRVGRDDRRGAAVASAHRIWPCARGLAGLRSSGRAEFWQAGFAWRNAMTWIKTIPIEEADEPLRAAIEGERALYPREYADPTGVTDQAG